MKEKEKNKGQLFCNRYTFIVKHIQNIIHRKVVGFNFSSKTNKDGKQTKKEGGGLKYLLLQKTILWSQTYKPK